MTPDEARLEAGKLIGAVLKREYVHVPRTSDENPRFAEFVDQEYRRWAEQRLRDFELTISRLLAIPELADIRIRDISPRDFERYRTRRLKDGIQKSTLNREFNGVRACLNRAVEWGILDANPLASVRALKVPEPDSARYLASDERVRLENALVDREAKLRASRRSANIWRKARRLALYPDLAKVTFADHLRPMVLLTINTGLRRGELFGLMWSHIDLVAKRLTVIGSNSKSTRTRHIPLNREAHWVLTEWQKQTQPGGFVFEAPGGGRFSHVRRSWAAVIKAAKIIRFRWHDLRHDFASQLVMKGVDLNTVRELLGHSDIKMTLRYAHLAPEHKAAAVAVLEG